MVSIAFVAAWACAILVALHQAYALPLETHNRSDAAFGDGGLSQLFVFSGSGSDLLPEGNFTPSDVPWTTQSTNSTTAAQSDNGDSSVNVGLVVGLLVFFSAAGLAVVLARNAYKRRTARARAGSIQMQQIRVSHFVHFHKLLQTEFSQEQGAGFLKIFIAPRNQWKQKYGASFAFGKTVQED